MFGRKGERHPAFGLSRHRDALPLPDLSGVPFFWNEVRAYKFVLNIGWRFGRRLVNQGVLVPDAYCDGHPLFRADGPSIARHKAAIADYRSAPKRSKPTL